MYFYLARHLLLLTTVYIIIKYTLPSATITYYILYTTLNYIYLFHRLNFLAIGDSYVK